MKIEVFDAIKQGIGLSFKNKTVLGLIALYSIWGIIYGIMIALYEIEPYPPVSPAFGINEALKLFATFFGSIVILYAIVKASFENLNKRDICISNAVMSALKKFIPIFMATIMYSIIVIVGLAVLIIPGIFLGTALFFYGHTILLNNKGVISSFKESYDIVKGNWWQVCALYLIFTIVSPFTSLLIVAFDLILPLHSMGIVLSVGTTFLIAGVAMVVLTIVYAQLIKKEEKIQTEKVSQENIYEEKIFPKTERWISGIGIALIVLIMAHMLIRISIDLILQDIGLFDLLVILFVILFIFFMPVIVAVIIMIMYIFREFREYNIKITSDSVIVDWEFKRTIPFEKIDDCYLEKRSIITRWIPRGLNPSTYIRRVNGKWRLRRDVSIIGVPRVVLSLKGGGFYKEFIFSTTNPEEVMKIINQQIGKIE